MERLTGKNNDYCFTVCGGERKHVREDCNIYKVCFERQIYERLKYYEDLAKSGRLVVLPCKVGDIVWVSKNKEKTRRVLLDSVADILWYMEHGYGIGFTREEAEAALKGEKGGETNGQ